MATAEQPITLEYGPSRRRRRRVIFRLMLVIAVGCALWGAWRLGEPTWKRYRARAAVASLIKQCLNDAPGKDVVAYEDDPVLAAPLTRRRGYLGVIGRKAGNGNYEQSAVRVPFHWYMLAGPRWSSGRPYSSDPVVFLHGRTALGGRQRLVVVQCMLHYSDPGTTEATLCAAVLNPDVPFGNRPTEVSFAWGPVVAGRWKQRESLRIFAAQADPVDPSHFTIDYESGGQRKVIDGWLQWLERGVETVVFKVR